MKQFKVGERVAFDYSGQRYRGKIAIWGYSDKICINTKLEHELEMKYCTNIKRLVKKKRIVIWVNEYKEKSGCPFGNSHATEEDAKKNHGTHYLRTVKFRECK